jgi:hypothetical protein
MEYGYQELLQQRVAFGCIKRIDLPALYDILRKLAPRGKDTLVHYTIAVSRVDEINNINIIFLQHLNKLSVFLWL